MIADQYIPPAELPEYPRWCAESAAALLRDLSRNADALGRASVADARAIRRALLDAEYLSRHVRLTLERG